MTAGRPSPEQGLGGPPGQKTGRSERVVCIAILAVLGLIALGVALKQASFNPAVLVAIQTGAVAANKNVKPTASAGSFLPSELSEFGVAEKFAPDNLYDKIDGKAELYLAAGFVQLECQRFALKSAREQWLEWFDFQMGSRAQAFSVYSTQRRTEGQPLSLVPYAYRTQNALYFVCGSHYVEAIASAPNESLITAAEAMARRMAASDPDNAAPIQELALFPSEDLVQRSYTLQTADAFGFDQFTNVFTAEYRAGEASVMAFITCCPTSREAAKLSKAYGAFLLANGGKEAPGGSDSGRRVEIMGGMEIIFTEGRFVWGIHNASSLPLAEKVAKQLRVKLVGSKGVRTSWGAASQFHA